MARLPARDGTYMMRKTFFELLTQLDTTGAECPGHTRAFVATMLQLLAPQDRYDTMRFLLEQDELDRAPPPKPPLRVISGGLS
jgi:hypothetical protein